MKDKFINGFYSAYKDQNRSEKDAFCDLIKYAQEHPHLQPRVLDHCIRLIEDFCKSSNYEELKKAAGSVENLIEKKASYINSGLGRLNSVYLTSVAEHRIIKKAEEVGGANTEAATANLEQTLDDVWATKYEYMPGVYEDEMKYYEYNPETRDMIFHAPKDYQRYEGTPQFSDTLLDTHPPFRHVASYWRQEDAMPFSTYNALWRMSENRNTPAGKLVWNEVGLPLLRQVSGQDNPLPTIWNLRQGAINNYLKHHSGSDPIATISIRRDREDWDRILAARAREEAGRKEISPGDQGAGMYVDPQTGDYVPLDIGMRPGPNGVGQVPLEPINNAPGTMATSAPQDVMTDQTVAPAAPPPEVPATTEAATETTGGVVSPPEEPVDQQIIEDFNLADEQQEIDAGRIPGGEPEQQTNVFDALRQRQKDMQEALAMAENPTGRPAEGEAPVATDPVTNPDPEIIDRQPTQEELAAAEAERARVREELISKTIAEEEASKNFYINQLGMSEEWADRMKWLVPLGVALLVGGGIGAITGNWGAGIGAGILAGGAGLVLDNYLRTRNFGLPFEGYEDIEALLAERSLPEVPPEENRLIPEQEVDPETGQPIEVPIDVPIQALTAAEKAEIIKNLSSNRIAVATGLVPVATKILETNIITRDDLDMILNKVPSLMPNRAGAAKLIGSMLSQMGIKADAETQARIFLALYGDKENGIPATHTSIRLRPTATNKEEPVEGAQ